MTVGKARLAVGVAALLLLAGCAAGGGRGAEPLPAAAAQTPGSTAAGVEAARGVPCTHG